VGAINLRQNIYVFAGILEEVGECDAVLSLTREQSMKISGDSKTNFTFKCQIACSGTVHKFQYAKNR
jgi:hypothetical protein